jgi:hypothetical protein
MMRAVRVTIGRLLAATLLTLCVGVQALEATGRWDRSLQDTGDEAVIVAVALCIGAALLAADAVRDRLFPSGTLSAIVVGIASVPLPIFVPPRSARSAFSASPPLGLRI